MKKIIYLLFSLVFVSSVFAQQGKVRGVIIDDENAETLIGVSVVVEGTTIGTITDLDGNYSLSLDPGSYTIVYSYISYASQRVTDVIVKAGETKIIDLRFKSDAE
ncbi:MAG: carboxypeptidase-like regulatory domain-containing protein, partial [Bacteroidetes bacterium]|nr:carboxypeptidase-like regulatory domain-containing protein [Bacteroidota bacterium]